MFRTFVLRPLNALHALLRAVSTQVECIVVKDPASRGIAVACGFDRGEDN